MTDAREPAHGAEPAEPASAPDQARLDRANDNRLLTPLLLMGFLILAGIAVSYMGAAGSG